MLFGLNLQGWLMHLAYNSLAKTTVLTVRMPCQPPPFKGFKML